MRTGWFGRLWPWAVKGLLTLGFLSAGLTKLLQPAGWIERFAGWGYAAWFVTLIGVLETVGTVGLWVPRLARPATALLTILMLGAGYTHLAHPPHLAVLRPAAFLLLLALVWLSSARRPGAPSGEPQ
jgi:putative oxidoreductase